MNLQKGLNRIFILLSLVVSLFGFMLGREYATESWKPEPEEAFHSLNWNEENIRKYYSSSMATVEERAKIEQEIINTKKTDTKKTDTNKKDIYKEAQDALENYLYNIPQRKNPLLDDRGVTDDRPLRSVMENYLYNILPDIKTEDLPNYEKSPPQYNGYIFQKTFPEALKTPAYKTWIGGAMGALIVFLPCYAGLHLILSITKWGINKFMIRDMLKKLDMVSGGLAYIVLKTLIFCAGIVVIMSSRRPEGIRSPTYYYYEPFQFTLGLAICIVSGVVLLKAIRDYLK